MKTTENLARLNFVAVRVVGSLFCLSLLALPKLASAITIDLSAAFQFPTTFNGREVIAVGRDGLFLDSNTNAPAQWQGNPTQQVAFANYADPAKNFTWTDVVMDINDTTGNATIVGTMASSANAADTYSLSMSLSGMCVRNGGTCQDKAALPSLDLREFLEDPINARNDSLGLNLDTGFEWSDVSLSVNAIPGGPAQVYNGVNNLTGWTMAPLHDNPVELYIWSNSPGAGSLYLAAWYQAFNQAGQRIATADTKAFGSLRDAPPSEIPEPATALLLGAAGLAALKRKKATA